MNQLTQLINNVNSQFLKYQSLCRLVKSDRFQDAYKLASDRDRTVVESYINQGRKNDVNLWVKRQLVKDIHLCPMSELREIARNYGVSGYYELSRIGLLLEIERSREKYDKRGNQESTSEDEEA